METRTPVCEGWRLRGSTTPRDPVHIIRIGRKLSAGVIRFDQQISMRTTELGMDASGPHWIVAFIRVLSGRLLFLADGNSIAAPASCAMILPPGSLIQVHLHKVISVFALDAASFLVAFVALMLIQAETNRRRDTKGLGPFWNSTMEGLRYCWSDGVIRGLILIVAAVNLSFTGPFIVGATLIAEQRFGGAVALGTMMSALGGGALLGSAFAGMLHRVHRRGWGLVTVLVIFAGGMLGLALVGTLVVAVGILAVVGTAAGFTNILAITLLQTRVNTEMLGRVMSVVMLSAVGLTPISFLVAGLIAARGLEAMFVGAAALLMASAAYAASNRAVREFR